MELVLGTAQFDGRYGRFRDSSAQFPVRQLLKTAWGSGFTTLDTAPAYSGVESAIGEFEWLGQLHTKVARAFDPLDSLLMSLKNLRRCSVEVLYFHDPGVLKNAKEYFKRARHSLPRVRVSFLGASIYTPKEMEAALGIPELEAIQVPVNIADGRFDISLFEQAQSQGVRIYARSLFLQGLLLQEANQLPEEASALRKVVQQMEIIAFETNRSLMDLAIGWARSLPGVAGLVLGAETPNQIRQLATAVDLFELTGDEISRLGALGLQDSALLDPRQWNR